MTPTDRGAFCQVCSKEVHDLSNSPLAEIRAKLFKNPNERMCIRIKSSQLQAINSDVDRWYEQDRNYPLRLFLFALFLVFGMSIFTGSAQASKIAQKVQEIHQVDDALTHATAEVGDSARRGLYDDDFYHQGIRIITPYGSGSKPNKSEPKADSTSSIRATKELEEPEELIEFDIVAYPNPTRTETTLKISVPDTLTFAIKMFSISGHKVRSFGTKTFPKGTSEFTIDLNSLPRGTYIVGFQGAEIGKTVSVVKL
ncbi:MAG: T9SS type A sorting domain-containing protein [Crocinitomicaceae bacterium]|nr:T9SS type A sorting domain-containing protein [Crocinitomicaceae bacterium]